MEFKSIGRPSGTWGVFVFKCKEIWNDQNKLEKLHRQKRRQGKCITVRVSPFRIKIFFAYKRNKANLDPFHMCYTISLSNFTSLFSLLFAYFLFKFFASLHLSNFRFEAKQSEAKFKRNEIFTSISNFASKAKVRARPNTGTVGTREEQNIKKIQTQGKEKLYGQSNDWRFACRKSSHQRKGAARHLIDTV
jgi:hypothetical protein